MIAMADLAREYAALRSEIDGAVGRVLSRGWFVLGAEGEAFEAEWASYCGSAHAIGVGNGTDAIQLALRAAGIGPGDEVIVPALTAAFTALAVSMTGATPVFADVDARQHTLDPAAFEAAITPRTVAVIPVHLYGCPADMANLVPIARRHDLLVLEDAAQAHGARSGGVRVGALGDVAAFSFYPSKNLGAYGDGGALVTDDGSLASRARALRHGGQQRTYEHVALGTNSRLDEIQAAILRAKLSYLDAWNEQRRALAARYDAGLAGRGDLVLPEVPDGVEHVYHLYVVRTCHRDELQAYLADHGIAAAIHYPSPVHLQPAYADLGYRAGACPNAEVAAQQVLSLPLYPQLEDGEAARVINAVRSFWGS
jgi:dTDP-4-amino-4,6-dideoxygalactose transaminase